MTQTTREVNRTERFRVCRVRKKSRSVVGVRRRSGETDFCDPTGRGTDDQDKGKIKGNVGDRDRL